MDRGRETDFPNANYTIRNLGVPRHTFFAGLSVPFFFTIKKGIIICLLYEGIGKQFLFSGYFGQILMVLLSLLDGQWADERNDDE